MPGTRSWLTSLGCQPRAKESFTLVASSTGLPWSWLLRQGKKMLTYRRNTLIGLNCSTPITPSFSSSETAPREPCCWWELWTTWRESPYTMNCSTLPPVALSFFSHLWCFFSFRIPLSKTAHWFLSGDIVIHCCTQSHQTTSGCQTDTV